MLSAGTLAAVLGSIWAMPRIDQWRGEIAQAVGERYGVRVDIDHIEARWSGVRPQLTVHVVHLYDTEEIGRAHV